MGTATIYRKPMANVGSIDTGTPSGRFFFHVMASLAEMERELIIERTRAVLDVARLLGRKGLKFDTSEHFFCNWRTMAQ